MLSPGLSGLNHVQGEMAARAALAPVLRPSQTGSRIASRLAVSQAASAYMQEIYAGRLRKGKGGRG